MTQDNREPWPTPEPMQIKASWDPSPESETRLQELVQDLVTAPRHTKPMSPTFGSDFWTFMQPPTKDLQRRADEVQHARCATMDINPAILHSMSYDRLGAEHSMAAEMALIMKEFEAKVRETRNAMFQPMFELLGRRLVRAAHRYLHAQQIAERKRFNKRKKQRRARTGRR